MFLFMLLPIRNELGANKGQVGLICLKLTFSDTGDLKKIRDF